MIAFLSGRLLSAQGARLVIDVQGVGYEVHVPASTAAQLPSPGAVLSLDVHTQVREDAIQLYGFATRREKVIFEHLVSVNGVGPKLALTMLSGLHPDALSTAIQAGDIARLCSISGVGRKTAERVVLELRDKLDLPAAAAAAPGPQADVVSALVNLGYARAAAETMSAEAAARHPDGSFETLLTACLRARPGASL